MFKNLLLKIEEHLPYALNNACIHCGSVLLQQPNYGIRLSDIVVYTHNGIVLSCKDQDPVTCVNGQKWKTPC